MSLTIQFQWDESADQNVGLPLYETAGAAGADLRANLPNRVAITLKVGARALVQTGFRMAIPNGFEAQIRPRSGLALPCLEAWDDRAEHTRHD